MNNTIKKTKNDFVVEPGKLYVENERDNLECLIEDETPKGCIKNKEPTQTIYNHDVPGKPYCASKAPCFYKKLIGRDVYCTWNIINKKYNENTK